MEPSLGSESTSWEQGLAVQAFGSAAVPGYGHKVSGGLLPPTTGSAGCSEASGKAWLRRWPFPKFQFLLINIISAPVQADKLTLSDKPTSPPVPNVVILTGSDERHSLFHRRKEKRGALTDRGQEAGA